jgi:hypothetical protein
MYEQYHENIQIMLVIWKNTAKILQLLLEKPQIKSYKKYLKICLTSISVLEGKGSCLVVIFVSCFSTDV